MGVSAMLTDIRFIVNMAVSRYACCQHYYFWAITVNTASSGYTVATMEIWKQKKSSGTG